MPKFIRLTPEQLEDVEQLNGLLVSGAFDSRDSEFARSLVASVARYHSLSDKQLPHVKRLIAKATQPAPERQKITIGELDGIITLFDQAKRHIMWPKIVLSMGHDADGNHYLVKLSLAGDNARVPGSINVTEYDAAKKLEPEGQLWYGRILRDGQFEISPKVQNDENAKDNVEFVVTQLREFSADPVGVATAHGKLTGNCCFCHLPLTDGRSTVVGYGPVCAKNWDLTWGNGEHEFKAEEVAPKPVVRQSRRNIRVGR